MQQGSLYLPKLLECEYAKASQEVLRRDRNTLDQECTFGEKWSGNVNLKLRAAHRSGVGITPIRARSASPKGMLITNAGRTFWVMPKSTCHTSPRLGTWLILLLVEDSK